MSTSYLQLQEHFRKLHHYKHLSSICSWDRAAMMPFGGNDARSAALSELSVLIHRHLTAPQLADWLNSAKQLPLNQQQRANLEAMERQWQQASLLPAELVQAKSLAESRCEHAWREQRSNNDWQSFAPHLTAVVKLCREEAQIRGQTNQCSPYDSLLDLYEPGMTSQTLDRLFGDLVCWLPSLIQEITERSPSSPIQPQGPFTVGEQQQLGHEIMTLLGFDFNRGRLDVSAHPFCGGVPEDVRITTRYDETDFTSALMGVIHETGHARYEQNLPAEWLDQPAGNARSVAIHESQSLFFEMQLARNPAFLDRIRPLLLKHFNRAEDPAFNLDNLLAIYRRVGAGYIRVDADEVTYPAHVILRYELERDLINGHIEVSDIPELWDQKMQQYLGLSTKDNYRDGCMQDIHWPAGAFGYFPSYTLGAMYAAQFSAAIEQQQGSIDNYLQNDDLEPIFRWLQQSIWSQGSLLATDSLVEQATGETLNPAHFKRHLEQRYRQ